MIHSCLLLFFSIHMTRKIVKFAVQNVLLKRIGRSMKSINNEERRKRDLTCIFSFLTRSHKISSFDHHTYDYYNINI